ncbi:hypothetical protein Tco_1118101, partial [Tanacetum coccineum]
VYIVDGPPMAVCTFDIAMLNEELILEKAKGWEEGEERMLGLHLLEFTENLIFRFLQSDEWTGEQKLQYGDIQYGEIPKDIEFSKPLTAPTYLNYGTQANTTGHVPTGVKHSEYKPTLDFSKELGSFEATSKVKRRKYVKKDLLSSVGSK